MVHNGVQLLDLPASDSDTCDKNEIDTVFSTKCQLLAEKHVASKNTYILHINGKRDADFNIAIATSNNSCEIYNFDNNHLVKLESLAVHYQTIVGIEFSPENSNLLYSATVDGNIRLWDLRLPKKLVTQFCDTTIGKTHNPKRLACFNASPNNRLLAVGTELHEGEAFILFWDIRNVKLLGGYWESHTDDITQIKFHPDDVNTLISGSTDGLINTYDLKQTSEDDALMDSLNTESSVEQLLWYDHNRQTCICCTTHTADVQLWRRDDAEPYAHFRRADIANEMRRKSGDHCYVIGAHNCNKGDVVILAGSNANDGKCLRALRADNKKLVPMFSLEENKQTVRSSWYNQHHNILVTGGENGILNAWQVNF